MPKGVKNIIPENEPRVTELGMVGRANKRTGKTEWVIERQSVGKVSGKVYDQIVLEKDEEDDDGNVTSVPVTSTSKPYCAGFLDGYNYRSSESE